MERNRERRDRARDGSPGVDRKRRDEHRHSDKRRGKMRSRSNSPRGRERHAPDSRARGRDRNQEGPPRHDHRHRDTRREEFHSQRSDYRRDRPTGHRRERRDNAVKDRNGERQDSHSEDSHYRQRRRDNREENDLRQHKFGGESIPEGSANSEADGSTKDTTDYGLSGKLTAETNTYRGVVIKYNEPEEARIPKTRWRLYGFKGDETLPTLYVHRQSAYLIGRNRKVVDMPVDHPSCSGQHAVLQYRLVEYEKTDGSTGKKVRPYIIDLESTNGTYINNNRVDAARYYELKEGDMLKFGFSSREYVILHENSQHDKIDVQDEPEEQVQTKEES